MLNLKSESFAHSESNSLTSFRELSKKIHKGEVCGIDFNPSKTAAVVDFDCGSAVYINFKTKKTYIIMKNQPGLIFPHWIDNKTAVVETSCGTGCTKALIFKAPATVVSCSDHEYRIESLDEHNPPDYYHNRPLLVDPKRGIYVCYDHDDNIQVFPLPVQATIHPPNGYFSEKAEIQGGKLVVTYENGHGKVQHIKYGTM